MIVVKVEDLVPDVSLGTHFFSEMVEMDILYFALFPDKQDSVLRENFFEEAPNKLPVLLPNAEKWSHVVKVIDPCELEDGAVLKINANNIQQRVVC